jgi:hypothetical protein
MGYASHMFRKTIVVLFGSLDPYARRLRILFTFVVVAIIGAMIIAPFNQFTDLVRGNFDRLNASIRSIVHYDFGVVWYPVLAIFVFSGIFFGRAGRRGEIGRGRAAISLVLPCVVFATAFWSLVQLFADLNYPGIQQPNWLSYLIHGSFLVTLLVTLIASIYWSGKLASSRLALVISASTGLMGWFGTLSALSVLPTDFSFEPKVTLVVSVLSFVWGVCISLAIYPHARLGDLDHDAEGSRSSAIKINVGSYLSSARNLSLLLLAFVITSIQVSSSYLSQVRDLQAARHTLAMEYAARQIDALAASIDDVRAEQLFTQWRSARRSPGGSDFPIKSGIVEGVGEMTSIINLYRADMDNMIRVSEVRVDVVGRGRWTSKQSFAGYIAIPSRTSVRDALLATALKLNQSRDALSEIAFRWQIDLPADSGADLVYRRIEREFVRREVSLPSVSVGVSSSTAMWWLAIGIVGLSILIRNQVGLVVRESTFVQTEPWLVLDQSKGLERLLANTWLWSIFLSPWIVGALLLMTVSSQTIADGISAPPVHAVARVLGLVTIPFVGGWSASSLVATLILLRRQRLSIAHSLTAENAENSSGPTASNGSD